MAPHGKATSAIHCHILLSIYLSIRQLFKSGYCCLVVFPLIVNEVSNLTRAYCEWRCTPPHTNCASQIQIQTVEWNPMWHLNIPEILHESILLLKVLQPQKSQLRSGVNVVSTLTSYRRCITQRGVILPSWFVQESQKVPVDEISKQIMTF